MKNILLDSDVLMDFFLDRTPFSEDASKVLSLCENGEIVGYVTPVIYSNLYYLLRRISDRQTAISQLRRLFSFTRLLVIDGRAVLAALHSDNVTDFDDALQNYAVEGSDDIRVIITRNVRDFRKSAVAVLTPSDYLKLRKQHL